MTKLAAVLAALTLAACSPAPTPAKNEPAAPAAPAAAPATVAALTVEKAVAHPPLGGQTTGVGYLVIRNAGDTADRLVAASSPSASSIELHTHSMTGGVMRMERVDGVDIPAHGEAVFQPRGLHLMIFNFAPTGPTAQVKLKFEMAGETTVDFAVTPAGADDPATAGDHMKGMN